MSLVSDERVEELLEIEAQAEKMRAEIERLRLRNAALVEIVREGKCPYDGRCTVGECQQCGCSLGILTANEQNGDVDV